MLLSCWKLNLSLMSFNAEGNRICFGNHFVWLFCTNLMDSYKMPIALSIQTFPVHDRPTAVLQRWQQKNLTVSFFLHNVEQKFSFLFQRPRTCIYHTKEHFKICFCLISTGEFFLFYGFKSRFRMGHGKNKSASLSRFFIMLGDTGLE